MQIRGKSRGYNKKEESANIYTACAHVENMMVIYESETVFSATRCRRSVVRKSQKLLV